MCDAQADIDTNHINTCWESRRCWSDLSTAVKWTRQFRCLELFVVIQVTLCITYFPHLIKTSPLDIHCISCGCPGGMHALSNHASGGTAFQLASRTFPLTNRRAHLHSLPWSVMTTRLNWQTILRLFNM